MFYVYDIDGLKFKGPMEQLEQWRTVVRKKQVHPLEEEAGFSPFQKGPESHAVATYEKIISKTQMVEPLVHTHQIMSSPAIAIHFTTPLTEAWKLLQSKEIRQLVVTTEKKKVLGLLSDRDILERMNIIDEKIVGEHDPIVKEVIKDEIITTDSISDIRRVAKVLAHFHIDALPVLERETLVGIVTRGDILRGFADNPKLNLWA